MIQLATAGHAGQGWPFYDSRRRFAGSQTPVASARATRGFFCARLIPAQPVSLLMRGKDAEADRGNSGVGIRADDLARCENVAPSVGAKKTAGRV